MDTTPPHLVSTWPDSGSTGLGEVTELRFVFSEKMDRANSFSWLYFFPDQRVSKTKWKGAVEAIVYLEEPLPTDTLVVVEVSGAMRDAHKVKNKKSRRFPLATADSIPVGSIAGVLLFEEGPLKNGVVELYGLQPDTLKYFRRPMIRRTVTDGKGAFVFRWLPVPSGPFLVRAFMDEDNNLRPGENDPQRLLPDTLLVDSESGTASAGVTSLYATNAPGRLLAEPFSAPTWRGTVGAWALAVTDADTGYYPEPVSASKGDFSWLSPEEGGTLEDVRPGLSRVIAFVDVDGDSAFSIVADTLLAAARRTAPDSFAAGYDTAAVDSVSWFLEPWVVAEGVELEPGLSATFELPAWGDSLTAWDAPPPPPAQPDTTAGALADSLLPPAPESETEEP